MKHTIREEIHGVAVFIGILWAVYFIDWVVPIDFTQWGLEPRRLVGLIGIPTMPFLHGSFAHLLSNSVPLFVLLVLLAGSRADTILVVCAIVLWGGALLWLLGRSTIHVGASGLVYGLVAFLILSGFLEKRVVPLIVALLVGFFYGTTLIWGVLPTVKEGVSWEGHLFGAIAGGLVAYFLARDPIDTPAVDDQLRQSR